ncbi:Ig-like domain-containing protein [Marinicella sp. W31]|uniref:Ig-like domain-containing protein n=1 Tax=Marinicella sp. W31 TaxID=3023713 RepID=UPI003756C466
MDFPRIAIFFCSVLLSTAGYSQEQSSISGSNDRINYNYSGDETRLGIGIDEDGEIIGDFLKSFGESYDSNWMGEAWFSDGAGGLKLNYHWIPGLENEQGLIDNADDLRIWKVFGALDQNSEDDRKLTLGVGSEAQDKFWNVNLSGAITDRRFVNQSSVTVTDIINGTLNGRDFIQNRSIETITRLYESPYDWGIGARYGRFFENNLIRLTGGLDYEQGDFSSDQFTGSISLEKYFNNTGHSVALTLEQLFKNGDFETEDDDTRASLVYRYDFGRTYRPVTTYEDVEVVDQEALDVLQKSKTQVIQNEIDLSSVAFFDLDQYQLREETKSLLDELVESINNTKLASNITVIGHTCWLGTDKYNQKLSERRASAAMNYLIDKGIPANKLFADGKGESEPAYNNEGPDIAKNRRVVISFLSLEDGYKQVPVVADEAPMKWERKEVQAPAAWINRALRNPALHKRRVDVYKEVETEQIETLGERVFLNSPPLAEDDSINIARNISGVVIDVLNNDSDPDEDDVITITDLTLPANGSVTNNGTSLSYTPNEGFIGTDTFMYTITDTEGNTASATVTIEVANNPPTAVDDNVTTTGNTPNSEQQITIFVLANDSDSDGTELTVKQVTEPTNGTIRINSDSSITYRPNDGFIGTDSVIYTITDADGAEDTATVTINVIDNNNAPIAVDDGRSTTMNRPVTLNVLENDSDPDGDVLTVVSVDTAGTLGTVEFQADGTVNYTPPADWCGIDTFTYTITDGFFQATATVSINILD